MQAYCGVGFLFVFVFLSDSMCVFVTKRERVTEREGVLKSYHFMSCFVQPPTGICQYKTLYNSKCLLLDLRSCSDFVLIGEDSYRSHRSWPLVSRFWVLLLHSSLLFGQIKQICQISHNSFMCDWFWNIPKRCPKNKHCYFVVSVPTWQMYYNLKLKFDYISMLPERNLCWHQISDVGHSQIISLS